MNLKAILEQRIFEVGLWTQVAPLEQCYGLLEGCVQLRRLVVDQILPGYQKRRFAWGTCISGFGPGKKKKTTTRDHMFWSICPFTKRVQLGGFLDILPSQINAQLHLPNSFCALSVSCCLCLGDSSTCRFSLSIIFGSDAPKHRFFSPLDPRTRTSKGQEGTRHFASSW